MYGMFAWWSGTEFRNTGGIPGPGMLGNINDYRSSLTQVVDLTHTFNPHLFLDVNASFNRSYNVTNDGAVSAGLAKLDASDLGLTMPAVPTTSHRYAPSISFSSAYANLIGNQTTPQMYETYQLSPSLSQVIGHHNLHYGAQLMLSHNIPCCGIGSANGNFYFDSSWTQRDPWANNNDGADLASLLLGYPASGGVDNNLTVYESYKYYAGYIQDDWKLRHNLTLNLGLRWDVETSPTDRFHRLNAGFCMTCANPLGNDPTYKSNIATFFPNNKLPNGATLVNPLVGGFRFSSDTLKPYDTQFSHWQPRFGFSWGLNNKTVLRGGYGINQAFAIELGGSTTWTQTTDYNSSADGLIPTSNFRSGNPFPNGVLPVQGSSLGLMTGVGSSQFFDQRTRKIPYVQQYSLGLQRELPAGIVLDVEYVGSYTKDLRVGTNFNILTPEQFAQGHATPNYLDQSVPNPFYGVLDPASEMGANPTIKAKYLMSPFPEFGGILYSYDEPGGYSNYNSLVVKAEKKLSGGGALINGLSFLTSFTWSKAMQATGYLNNGAVGDGCCQSGLRDKNLVYMLTSSDRPWDLAFSGVYGLPIGKDGLIGKDAHGAAGQLLNNWTVDYIFTFSGGTPTVLTNSYIYSCSQNGGSFKPKKQTWSEWLYNETPTCFSSMTPYTAKTIITRQSGIRNPSVPQLALALGKKFALKEGLDLQFKAEAFNLTNTPLFGGPSTGSPKSPIKRNPTVLDGQPGAYSGYGTIGSMQQNLPRQLQMSLKLFF